MTRVTCVRAMGMWSLCTAVCCAAGMPTASGADAVVKLDGERIEGEIVGSSEQAVLIVVEAADGRNEVRTVPTKDIHVVEEDGTRRVLNPRERSVPAGATAGFHVALPSATSIPSLFKEIQSKDEDVRVKAIKRLGQMREKAKGAREAFLALHGERSAKIREAASEALVQIDGLVSPLGLDWQEALRFVCAGQGSPPYADAVREGFSLCAEVEAKAPFCSNGHGTGWGHFSGWEHGRGRMGYEHYRNSKAAGRKIVDAFERAKELGCSSPYLDLGLGVGYMRAWRFQEAVDSLRSAEEALAAADPEGVWRKRCLGYVTDACLGVKQWEEAARAGHEALTLDPVVNWDCVFYLAALHGSKKGLVDRDLVVNALVAALEHRGNLCCGKLVCGFGRNYLGRNSASKLGLDAPERFDLFLNKEYQEHLHLYSEIEKGYLYFQVAYAYVEMGMRDKAIEFYEESLRPGRSRPGRPENLSWNNLAYVYYKKRDWANAVRCYEELYKRCPNPRGFPWLLKHLKKARENLAQERQSEKESPRKREDDDEVY